VSYDVKEKSVQDARPVLLFTFRQGSLVWYYCTGSLPVVNSGHTYNPEPLLPGNIANTGDVAKDTLEIKLPVSNALAALFLLYTPDAVTTVTVIRTHYDNTSVRNAWKGRVLSFSAAQGVVTFICESVFSSERRLGLRETYQRLCRHVLGGQGCNVNIATYSAELLAVGIDGPKVTLSAALAVDYQGGTLLAPDGTRRMIVDIGADFVVLMRPVQALVDALIATPAGVAVTLYQGCDRSTSMCTDRFNNIGNFGGFPGIPWINPMTNISSVF
jgi:uncharacterized phage protein (TIGR02218 family)